MPGHLLGSNPNSGSTRQGLTQGVCIYECVNQLYVDQVRGCEVSLESFLKGEGKGNAHKIRKGQEKSENYDWSTYGQVQVRFGLDTLEIR